MGPTSKGREGSGRGWKGEGDGRKGEACMIFP